MLWYVPTTTVGAVGNDGNTYNQDYIGISPTDGNDVYFRFTVDGSHLIFE